MMRFTSAYGLFLATSVLLPSYGYALEANDVTRVDWDKDNTVHMGSSINTVYRIMMAGGSRNDLWLNIDCNTQTKTLLYMNLQTPVGKDLRVYGSRSIGRYIPGIPFEPDADSLMSTDPALNICQQKIPQPRWVGLSLPDKNADQLFAPIKTLCSLKDLNQFTGFGPRVERQKTAAEAPLTLPDFTQNDPSALARYPLAESVNNTIRQVLDDTNSTPTFSRLTFTQVWPGPDDSSAQTRIDRLPDGSTLTLDTLILKGIPFYIQYQRLFNLVNLKEWDSMQNSPLISQSLETDFNAAPIVGKQYRWLAVMQNAQDAPKSKSKSQVCLVESTWHDASMLNEKFPGRYLELSCTDDRGDGKAMSSDYAWLEDLRIFIRIGYQEDGKKKRFMFKEVEIIR